MPPAGSPARYAITAFPIGPEQVSLVPQDNGGHDQVEAGGAVLLALVGAERQPGEPGRAGSR
jgi:hypothetical protein